MRSNRIKGLLVLAGMAVPLAVLAAKDEPQARWPAFEQLDANHDGGLSRSELPASLHDLRAHFDNYALVGNRISPETYRQYVASHATPLTAWAAEAHRHRPGG